MTDDPVPTAYRNWEIYGGVQYQNECCANVSTSAPFAEFNYGAMPNVQVSITLPMQLTSSPGTQTYGYGPTDFGLKTRFVQEAGGWPQISFFPSVAIPSGSGHAVTFLPLWLQKSWGKWTAFGGGGLYLNAGTGQRNYTFIGTTLERSISPATTIGAEIYHQSAPTPGGPDLTATNVGITSQIGAYHALLLSFGRAFHGPDTFSLYASYEFELAPTKSK